MDVGRLFYFALGWVCVAIGIIGAFVPLLPTTIFLIAAAACFAKSSRRLERRLLEDRRFGPAIHAWRQNRAISKRGKSLALVGMAIGFIFFLLTAATGIWSTLAVAGFFLACAYYVVSRPTAAI